MIDIHIGDCREVLKTLPEKSINCCVTSPPYFGLRDYGHADQMGLEDTPEKYIAELVEVFREVKRVLRDDGTIWLNIGDSYNASSNNRTGQNGFNDGRTNRDKRFSVGGVDGLKPKDLIGIPWMLAFALRADGWYLRQDIIWHKPNPMPESVKDRCTKAHEYIFLLSKSPKYYFDSEAIKEPVTSNKGNAKTFRGGVYVQGNTFDNSALIDRDSHGNTINESGMKNKRSVWTVSPYPYKEAHFATFPPELITPCILAGCPDSGTVLDPFGGSGTVGEVCRMNNRNAILIELNPEYRPLIEERTMCNLPELSQYGVL